MKLSTHIRESGPYRVQSLSDGSLRITPAWPQFPEYTDEDGGGPGLLSRMALAGDISKLLNGEANEDG